MRSEDRWLDRRQCDPPPYFRDSKNIGDIAGATWSLYGKESVVGIDRLALHARFLAFIRSDRVDKHAR